MKLNLDTMTPRQIVEELDRYIIGQQEAKRAVAVALRNRSRRQKLDPVLRDEVHPKNIIMIGPTGVGKTEIARRLSKLSGAPFLKVEATKFTEVGYVGRDVDSMIRDLMNVSLSLVKAELRIQVEAQAQERVEEQLLDLLLPGSRPEGEGLVNETREKLRAKLAAGELEEKNVEIQISSGRPQGPSLEIFSGTNFEEIDMNLGALGQLFGGKKKKKTVTVRQARELLLGEEREKLVDQDQAVEIARDRCQNWGIVFIDEIDKIASRAGASGGADVSREGVQRDILPLIEGSKVNTKYGTIDTSHILFIAAGAFHISKPSDLIPELQGRFPIRVELGALTEEDFLNILTTPENSLTLQYKALLATEGVTVEFQPEALRRLARLAVEANSRTENIGARRLHTLMERLLEELSFTAPELKGQAIPITEAYVDEQLARVVQDADLGRYIL